MLITNLLHNTLGISVAFQQCEMTKGILLFPVARSKSIPFELYYIYKSTIMVVRAVKLTTIEAVLIMLSVVILAGTAAN